MALELHTVWMIFSADKNAMQVAFSPTICDVAPKVVTINLPELCKPLQNPNLCVSRKHMMAC